MTKTTTRSVPARAATATALRRALGWLLLAVLSVPIVADAQQTLPDKFKIQVGGFFVTRASTALELAAKSGPITAVPSRSMSNQVKSTRLRLPKR